MRAHLTWAWTDTSKTGKTGWVKVYAEEQDKVCYSLEPGTLILEFVLNNTKVGDVDGDVIIFNMSSATACASRALGLCSVPGECYAIKFESGKYKGVLPARTRQGEQWTQPTNTLVAAFQVGIWEARRRGFNPKWFRYNEAGDFVSQACVAKLNTIAAKLRDIFGIRTFGYTARKDLDFSARDFVCLGSGWEGPDGRTMVLHKGEQLPPGYKICPGQCRKCRLCKVVGKRRRLIAFPKH